MILERKSEKSDSDLFQNYKKHVIVWEQELEKMVRLGYERPTIDEGFDDFTYHVS